MKAYGWSRGIAPLIQPRHGMVVLQCVLTNRMGRHDWINLTWDINKWRAVVGREINIGFS